MNEEAVYAEPQREIGHLLPNQVEELYLANKGITHLRGFDRYTNLGALFLHENRLMRLNGLTPCLRLTYLSVHTNRLVSISALRQLKYLDTLLLHKNQLASLDKTLDIVANLPMLTMLTLFGNPLEETYNYRPRVLAACPSLEVFDRRKVTKKERQSLTAADYADSKGRRVAFGTHVETDPIENKNQGVLEHLLFEEAAAVERARAQEAEAALEAMFSQQQEERKESVALPPLPNSLNFLAKQRPKAPPSAAKKKPAEETNKPPTVFLPPFPANGKPGKKGSSGASGNGSARISGRAGTRASSRLSARPLTRSSVGSS